MYLQTSLGQSQTQTDCSGWETDPQSFTKVIAEHHILTELGKPLSPTGGPYQVTKTAWRINFQNGIAVYVTLAKVPDFVAAARWYPKPAGKSRFYAYSCTSDGQVVFTERKQP
ncbi:MAG: hypothetical protein NTAFB01_19630 [Nitrospira sp.]